MVEPKIFPDLNHLALNVLNKDIRIYVCSPEAYRAFSKATKAFYAVISISVKKLFLEFHRYLLNHPFKVFVKAICSRLFILCFVFSLI